MFRTRTSPDAIDLVSQLLQYDPEARVRPMEACCVESRRRLLARFFHVVFEHVICMAINEALFASEGVHRQCVFRSGRNTARRLPMVKRKIWQ